jgi:hypothetical protein
VRDYFKPDSASCEEQTHGFNFSKSIDFNEEFSGQQSTWAPGKTFGYRLREDVTYSGGLQGTITGALKGTAQNWMVTLNTNGEGTIRANLKITGVKTKGSRKKQKTETRNFGVAMVIATFTLADSNDIRGSCDSKDNYSIDVKASQPQVVINDIQVNANYTGPFALFAAKTARERMATGLISHIKKNALDAQSKLAAQKNGLIEALKPKLVMACLCLDALTDPPNSNDQSPPGGTVISDNTQIPDQSGISCLSDGYTWIRNNPASSGICRNPSSGLCYRYSAGDVQYANGPQECS